MHEVIDRRRAGRSAVNGRMICRVLGVLVLIEVLMFVACAGVAWLYGEAEVDAFLWTALAATGCAGVLLAASRGADRRLGKRDGYCIASLTWVLFTALGMLPFLLCGSVETAGEAFFETMSGFTTTGATILDDIDHEPHAILFWRALTHWIGGLGIVLFALAVLPIFGEGSLQLFSGEAVGVTHDKIHSKVNVMARLLWSIYLGLTVACIALLRVGGMGWFDAVCHSMATVATGGFSTRQASIAAWQSPFIEYVVAVFMMLSAVNFSLYFSMLKGRPGKIWHDEETRWFLGSILMVTGAIACALVWQRGYDVEHAFRSALFQVASLHTSTGFGTDDYMHWPPFTWILLVYAMLAGGCTGSTSGGIKALRLVILAKAIRNHLRRMLHPNAVLPVRVNRQAVSQSVVLTVGIFVICYLLCIFIGWLGLVVAGVELIDAFGVAISSMGNAGMALGNFGPAYSWSALPEAGKWISSALMLVGRLEMFAIMLMFYSAFWRKH